MGKRKIAIEKIVDRQKRSATFTKRRDGLFKKAETACQKFGLQIGIVVFSPAGKPFTFSNSSSVSVDAIIDRYMSNSSSSSSSSSSSAVVVGKRSRSDGDDDDVQVIETEKKKKKRKTLMNNAVVIPCITVQEEKLDEGFHWDHYKNIDSDQTYDQELRNELMGYGENEGIFTEEIMESSQFLVEGDCYNWASDVELQEIVNVEDFEYDDHHHHCDDKIMGLLPPPHTTTTSTSLCNSTWSSDMNEEEAGGSNEEYGYTLEEWEHIFGTSPTSVVGNSTWSSSYINQEVLADWPTQGFLQLLCS